MRQGIFAVLMLLISRVGMAQFPGGVGTTGCTAIAADSNIIVSWANQCSVQRGFTDIADTTLGYATVGDDTSALGPANGSVVSLGDGGSAILTFPHPIMDEPGPDFAVFENAFLDNFLELAFVEVSSDGEHFVRFPAVSNTPAGTQVGPFDAVVQPEHLNNLAGKYRAMYGTPFDLAELEDSAGLNIHYITHVKLIDVIGTIDSITGSRDALKQIINDPYPTPFPSSGFDLDAVGVIHQLISSVNEAQEEQHVHIYPTVVARGNTLNITGNDHIASVLVFNYSGQMLIRSQATSIDCSSLTQGVYMLSVVLSSGEAYQQRFVVLP